MRAGRRFTNIRRPLLWREADRNVYFLANRPRTYDPCSNLFEKLSYRLADRALVVSDGSNALIRQLLRFHNSPTDGRSAWSAFRQHKFEYGDFHWSCVGWLTHRNGPTLVWG